MKITKDDFTKLLCQSMDIVYEAIEQYKPYAICLMLSGGDDSLLAFEVAKWTGIHIDYIIHGNTRTGLPATTNFVRELAEREGVKYLEADAGDAYRNYVLRKGFFGKGKHAHSFSYHVLKAQPFRKTVSAHIRQRKRNRPILLINGVRLAESANRADNMQDKIYNPDPAAKNNIWVNIVHYWSNEAKDEYLKVNNISRNPVAVILGRSGECNKSYARQAYRV